MTNKNSTECSECTNDAMDGSTMCEWCDTLSDQPPHEGHVMWITGAWYCDTCNSPYCELA